MLEQGLRSIADTTRLHCRSSPITICGASQLTVIDRIIMAGRLYSTGRGVGHIDAVIFPSVIDADYILPAVGRIYLQAPELLVVMADSEQTLCRPVKIGAAYKRGDAIVEGALA
jgi:hypothetical protein